MTKGSQFTIPKKPMFVSLCKTLHLYCVIHVQPRKHHDWNMVHCNVEQWRRALKHLVMFQAFVVQTSISRVTTSVKAWISEPFEQPTLFYWPFQGGTSFVDLLCFCSVLCLLCFVRVCLYVLRGHLLGKGWPLGSRLWCLLWVCHFPIGILGQVWYLIVSIPDLCNLTYFDKGEWTSKIE